MKVRLSKEEIDTIKKFAKEIFGDCDIYIFGSRLYSKKGGDIDIFIIPKDKSNIFRKKIKLSARLENKLFKPVDIIVSKDKNRDIEREALKGIKI
ncbi:MAG: nucleotidyltransferase domain-containing protein [Persephonella sp.]|nr:MAG: nucleotidyltransferase domain-containing protein [Persephonella sp.]